MSTKFMKRRKENKPAQSTQARTREVAASWTLLSLAELRQDGNTQSRVATDDAALSEYVDHMSVGDNGVVLDPLGEAWPPITVFHDGDAYWLADGFHRVAAAERAEIPAFQAKIERGELREAIKYSLSANRGHGIRRTNQDKRFAVERALQDEEWGLYSDNQLARLCGISAPTAAKYRRQLEAQGAIEPTTQRVGADGEVYDVSAHVRRTPSKRPARRAPPARTPAAHETSCVVWSLEEPLTSLEPVEPRVGEGATLVFTLSSIATQARLCAELAQRPGSLETVLLTGASCVAVVYQPGVAQRLPRACFDLDALARVLAAGQGAAYSSPVA
ncbi:MAG: hypothetical protein AAGI01_09920 [Myxococcota bacterium]